MDGVTKDAVESGCSGDAIDRDDFRDFGSCDGLFCNLSEHSDRHELSCTGIAQLECDFVCAVRGVHRGDNSTGNGNGVEDDGVLRQVGCHQSKSVARSEAASDEPTGEAVDDITELGERIRAPGSPIDERRLFRVVVYPTKHKLSDWRDGDVDCGKGARIQHVLSIDAGTPELPGGVPAFYAGGRSHTPWLCRKGGL